MNNISRQSDKKFLLLGVLMILLGLFTVAVGALDLLDQEGIVRSILYVFGAGVGRVFISAIGVLMITMAVFLLRLAKQSQVGQGDAQNIR